MNILGLISQLIGIKTLRLTVIKLVGSEYYILKSNAAEEAIDVV